MKIVVQEKHKLSQIRLEDSELGEGGGRGGEGERERELGSFFQKKSFEMCPVGTLMSTTHYLPRR